MVHTLLADHDQTHIIRTRSMGITSFHLIILTLFIPPSLSLIAYPMRHPSLTIARLRLSPQDIIPSDTSTTDELSNTKSNLYPNFSFTLLKTLTSSNARTGLLDTPHGTVRTPAFVFCATKAAMKSVSPRQLREENTQFILSNTYHLMLTPGSELIHRMGGLQKWTGWNGPMLTDSGGYQIFSMGHGSVSEEIKGNRDLTSLGRNQTLMGITEEGATFKSYVDGTIHHLTPERSIEIQRQLGADLIVVLDECTPFNVDKEYTAESMRRSHRWAIRSLNEFKRINNGQQALYGIIQGGIYEDLRKESAMFINDHSFFGTAIGGSLGDNRKTMHDIVEYTRNIVRNDRPVHLLGIGGIRDIFHGVKCGIDSFDCVHPSRIGRHGGAFVKTFHWDEIAHIDDVISDGTKRKVLNKKSKNPLESKAVREHINVTKGRFRNDPRPIDPQCSCYCCTTFTRAYLHHLFKAKETLGGVLVTTHNVHFMNTLMADIRDGIDNDTLDEVERKYVHPLLRLSAYEKVDATGVESMGS